MRKLISRLWPEDQAEDIAEFALLLMLLVAMGVTTMKGVASTVGKMYAVASAKVMMVGNNAADQSGSASNAAILGGGGLTVNLDSGSYRAHKKTHEHDSQ